MSLAFATSPAATATSSAAGGSAGACGGMSTAGRFGSSPRLEGVGAGRGESKSGSVSPGSLLGAGSTLRSSAWAFREAEPGKQATLLESPLIFRRLPTKHINRASTIRHRDELQAHTRQPPRAREHARSVQLLVAAELRVDRVLVQVVVAEGRMALGEGELPGEARDDLDRCPA